ncbi:TetR/AcrR family transcriptional regulator [Sinomonas gamaensis]|uniref:TetR/AcrR family transcriptional regulator n=1 Tax=Sinomonas gamaensis TaxID=2565624 RepID=UPI00110866DA|nr:TetR/AcrR family transcriptional regulator [Sinomonas gamaensis]
MMAREPKSLRDRQRVQTQTEILEAVIDVIAADSADGPVVEQIAAQAGVSRATLYAHFPGGMEEMATKAYELAGLKFIQRVQAIQADSTSWRERIAAHARAMVDIAEDRSLGRFYNISAARYASIGTPTGAGSRASYDDFVRELTTGRDQGELAEIDIEETARLLVGAVRVVGVRAAEFPELGLASLRAFERILDGLRQSQEAGAGPA